MKRRTKPRVIISKTLVDSTTGEPLKITIPKGMSNRFLRHIATRALKSGQEMKKNLTEQPHEILQ